MQQLHLVTGAQVISIRKHAKNERWRYVDMIEQDGKALEVFSSDPSVDKLQIGSGLPEGWSVEEGPYGLRMVIPRPQQGTGRKFEASWRNTEEGFKYEQSRMDRRTALMQAVALRALPTTAVGATTVDIAEQLFVWLRKE